MRNRFVNIGGRTMKFQAMLGLSAVVIAALLFAGCTDEIEEALNPEVELQVMSAMTSYQSPESPRENVTEGYEYVYVKIELTNKNENLDQIFWAYEFGAEDAERNPYDAMFLSDLDEREQSSFNIKPEETKEFYVVFEVEVTVDLTLLILEMGADEDFTADIPSYTHLS